MTVFDFAALPPEVNSARIYAGAGSGSLVSAAAGWEQLATELTSAASSYQSVISELTSGSWLGPSSTAAAAAAAPYVEWINTTATQAQQTASQARSAAAAYETAFSATVPPALIATNRATLAQLVASNVVGQNTAAIAANEAQYGQFWAQDAAAMYSYSAASAAATQLTPFSDAPQTTNQAGTSAQAAAASSATSSSSSSAADSIYTDLLNFLNSPLVQDFETISNGLYGYLAQVSGASFALSGAGFVVSPFLATTLLPATAAAQALATPAAAAASDVSGGGLAAGLASSPGSAVGALGSAGLGEAGVEAGLARAATVGGLSVPQAWGSAAPEIRLAATSLPMAGPAGLPLAAPAGLGGMPAIGPIGSVVNAPRNGEPDSRNRLRAKLVAQTGAQESGGEEDTKPKWGNFDECVVESRRPRTERDELNDLRRSIATLTKERDILKRSAALLIKEATQR